MKIIEYAVKYRTAVVVFTIASTILGLLTYFTMPREGPPDITIPYVFVTAPYEGTAPVEIENLITIPLEKQFNDLENVKEVRSVSSEGVAVVVIEFTPRENLNNALQRVKDKIDQAKPNLPLDLDEPLVDVINFSTDMPILNLAVSGELGAERLRKLTEDMQEQIENIAGVKEVDLIGAREREIRVEIDPVRLSVYKLPMGAVMNAIVAANKTMSAGNIEMEGGKFQVRVPGEFALAAELREVVVSVRNGQPIYLTDVAEILDTHKDLETISRLKGKPCLSLAVKKRSGENTLALIDKIKLVIERFARPDGVEIEATHDQSEFISSMVEELENSMVSGSLLVFAVLLLSMGWRNSIFVGLAIPLSMFISFIVMAKMGITLNFIVLFGLVMAAGMLVDDAVVIVENIFRNRSLGLSRSEAAVRGAQEVAWPVSVSTLTALLFLWPLLSWPGIMGQFLRFLPITIILTRTASLLVALVINPAMCSFYITAEKAHKTAVGEEQHPILDRFERFLRGAMEHRGLVLVMGLMLFVLTVQFYSRFNLGLELFRDTEPRRAVVEVKYPQGTQIEKTDAAIRQIESKLSAFKNIRFFLANVGMGGDMERSTKGTHLGSVAIEFLAPKERTTNTLALVDEIRREIGQIAGAEIKVSREKMGPPTPSPVSIEVSGDDFDTLSQLSSDIMRAIQGVPGLVDVQDDLEDARPEFQIRLDRKRIAMLGLDTQGVGSFLRTAIYGTQISKFQSGEEEYDITVRLPARERSRAEMLSQLYIPLPDGQTIPLSSVGQVVFTGGRGDIMRKDQKRVITIRGEKLVGQNMESRSIDAILEDVRSVVDKITLPSGYAVQYSGENQEMNEAGTFLLNAFGIGVAFIVIVLVIEFNSVFMPVVILITVFLAMIGVMWGLLIAQMRFGVIMTGLGVLTLAGLVVNNAIVLIDCIIHKRQSGMSAVDSAVAGARQRLRPVLLTAATTILGLIPMAIGLNIEIHTFPWKIVSGAESGEWWAPMAVAVIFGLSVATVLTMVVVPVMYAMAESGADRLRSMFAKNSNADL